MNVVPTACATEDIRPQLLAAARLQQAGQAAEAEAAYRRILEQDPDQPDAHHLLGLILAQGGQHEPACRHIRRAIAGRGDMPDYHNSLGVVLSWIGKLDQAAAAFQEALGLRPDYLAANYNLALALHRAGQLTQAAVHYRMVLKARPEDGAARNNLGCALRDLHEPAQAAEEFRRVLAIDPGHDQARQNLTALEMDAPAATAAARMTVAARSAQPESAAPPGPSPATRIRPQAAPGSHEVAPNSAQAAPVIITAPTERNGVTLLQRLLNSTRQIIVYGEDSVLFQIMPGLFFDKLRLHLQHGAQGDAVRRRFLEESTEFWTSGLWPETEAYTRTMGQCFEKLLAMYADSARRLGFARWGIKHPLTAGRELDQLRQLLPAARILFIYRNLFDVARSAKARRFARDPEQMADLGRRWQANLLPVLQQSPAGTLVMRHEELTAEPEAAIVRIETFTGLSGIDRAVLQRRFNTFAGSSEQGYSPTEYIEPQALTREEDAALRTAAREALAATGYEDAEPPPRPRP